MPALSASQVKLLSQILHTTSKSLGRPSKLASQREMLSHLLGFNDWNGACAMLPDQIPNTTHVAIALLEVRQQAPKTFMCIGNDAPWRLPEKVRDHLIKQSLNPSNFTVSRCSRPDPVEDAKPRYSEYMVFRSIEDVTTYREAFDPNEPDYRGCDHTPIVMTFASAQGHSAFKLTVWLISLHPKTGTATNFTGAVSMPLYNTLIESITGHLPELRQAYCLVGSRDEINSYAIVRCDEMGSELELVKSLPYLSNKELWAHLKQYNSALGLSLLDVADITAACSYMDREGTEGTW